MQKELLFWLPSSIELSLSVTWIAKRQDNLQNDDKSNPTLGAGRICMFLMTIHTSKICVRIGINLAHIT